MNPVYAHLLLNHIPVLSTLLGIPVLVYGWMREEKAVIQVGLAFFVLGGLSALPVYFSGEGAEEAVEHLPGILENLIEEHEEFAEIALFFIEALALSALGALFVLPRKPEFSRWMMSTVLFLSFINAGTISRTAYLGGHIRHSEIHSSQANEKEHNSEPDRESHDRNQNSSEDSHDED